jgi:hypothetical protein
MAKPILLSNNLAQQQQYITLLHQQRQLYIVGAGMKIQYL